VPPGPCYPDPLATADTRADLEEGRLAFDDLDIEVGQTVGAVPRGGHEGHIAKEGRFQQAPT